MSPMPYNETGDAAGAKTLYVFLPGRDPVIVQDDHPNYEAIKEAAQSESPEPDDIVELADASIGIGTSFELITDRISVAHGRVFFDGDEVNGAITTHILRATDEAEDEEWPYAEIAFLEKVQQNPSANSREQLYDWLDAHDFTITREGDIVGYKGVHACEDEEYDYQSGYSGSAIVDGEIREGRIPQNVGSTVTMPRSEVEDNPRASCSRGLHVGTFSYAKGFAKPTENVLKVLVNPRDVVSVPSGESEKVRVCRYEIQEDKVTEAVATPVQEAATTGIPESRDDGVVYSPVCSCAGCKAHREKYSA